MHRFYLPPNQCAGTRVVLEGNEAHHALNVLRLREGAPVLVLDGAGHEYSCLVIETERRSVTMLVEDAREVPPLPCSVTLVQAIPKGKIIESIIQKATELGASRIVPLLSERVVSQLDSEEAADKAARWQQVAIEAIKQCGNAWLPVVEQPVTPLDWVKRAEQFDLTLIGSLRANSRHPREHIERYVRDCGAIPQSISVWVGPEGDFTEDEYAAAEAAGALPMTLGRLVLRSETAAIYCLSILSYEVQWQNRSR